MCRWRFLAVAMLMLSATLPARADDVEDCNWSDPFKMPTDPAKVLAACKRLADQGYAFAQNNPGVMYDLAGKDAEAAKWFLKAAVQDSPTAQENL